MHNFVHVLAGPGPGGGFGDDGTVAPIFEDGVLDYVIVMLRFIVNTFSKVVDWFTMTFGEFVEHAVGWVPLFGDNLSDTLTKITDFVKINGVSLTDYPVILVMFGSGIFIYMIVKIVSYLFPVRAVVSS